MVTPHRRPGTNVLERVGKSMRQSPTKDWGGRLPAMPKGASGGVGGVKEINAGKGKVTRVHKVTLDLTASQTPFDNDNRLSFSRAGGGALASVGFEQTMQELASGGLVSEVIMSLTGELEIDLSTLWESYSDGGDITITLSRNYGNGTIEETFTLNDGPISSRYFSGNDIAIDVVRGDVMTITVPGGASDVVLSGQLRLRIIELHEPPAFAPFQPAEVLGFVYDEGTGTGADTLLFTTGNSKPDDVPFTPEVGDIIVYAYIGDGVSSGNPDFVVPSGYTEVMSYDTGLSAANMSVGYKVSDGTETQVLLDGGGNNHAGGVIRFACCLRNADWVDDSVVSTSSSASHPGTGKGRLIIGLDFYGSTNPPVGQWSGGSASLDNFFEQYHGNCAAVIAIDPDGEDETYTISVAMDRIVFAEVRNT